MALALFDGMLHLTRAIRVLENGETKVLLYFFPKRTETERRLQEAKAKSGDVEITLTWNNINDIDLHCIDPAGEHIFYAQKQSRKTAGELDVDRNAGPPYTETPVEHIYWPSGKAPAGRYRVYVDYYSAHGAPDPTEFQVEVRQYGKIQKYAGSISREFRRETREPGLFICEFSPSSIHPFFLNFNPSFFFALLIVGLLGAVIAGLLSLALMTGIYLWDRFVIREKLHIVPQTLFFKTLFCAGWGFFVGVMVQCLYALLPPGIYETRPEHIVHVGCVILFGMLLAFVLSKHIPKLRRRDALLASLVAGSIGTILYVLLYTNTPQWIARNVLEDVFGFFVGMMIVYVRKPAVIPPPAPPMPPSEPRLEERVRPLKLRPAGTAPVGKLRRTPPPSD